MLEVCGVKLHHEDVQRLIVALRRDNTASSREAAEAIRWGTMFNLRADTVEPDMRRALLKALDGKSPRLVQLRAVLERKLAHTDVPASEVV